MEVLFHFAFEIVKIIILSCIYASLSLLIFFVIGKYRRGGWFERNSRKIRWWFINYFVIWIGLFMYMFSYWGNHGLGDFARIPLGSDRAVKQIDASSTFIENEKGNQIGIKKFNYDGNNLYAEISEDFKADNNYVVWNLKTGECEFYKIEEDYKKVADEKGYPLLNSFHEFNYWYDKYWNTWRFWLLP